MHNHVSHTDLVAYAVNKVNLPSETAKARRDQVNHLRTRLESYIAVHPDYALVKMRAAGSVAKHTAIASSSDADPHLRHRDRGVGLRHRLQRVGRHRLRRPTRYRMWRQ